MESSGERVLKELASREQALSARVAEARAQAERVVAEAEAKAKQILAQADADAKALAAEYRARREAEEKSITEAALSSARTAADNARAGAEGRVPEAVRHIVRRVLP